MAFGEILRFWPILDFLDLTIFRYSPFIGTLLSYNDSVWGAKRYLFAGNGASYSTDAGHYSRAIL